MLVRSDHVRGKGDSPVVGDVPHERAGVGRAPGGGGRRQKDLLVEAERADAVVPDRRRRGGAREPRDQQEVRKCTAAFFLMNYLFQEDCVNDRKEVLHKRRDLTL